MAVFNISIADHIIEVHSVYERVFNACKKFYTDEQPDLCIHITIEDIHHERVLQGLTENKLFPEEEIEVLCLLHILSDLFIDDGIILFHGAAVALHNNAFLFSAKSGTGKTVHAIRWILNNRDAIVVNGDKPFIMIKDKPLVCGSPWAGKEGMCKNVIVPLRSIVIMKRSDKNHIQKISFSEAFPFLLQQVYRPRDESKYRKTIQLLQRLNKDVSFWKYDCNNFKEDCYEVVYNALVKGQL